MNKIFIIILALVAFNAALIYAQGEKENAEPKKLVLPLDKFGCFSGGPGASSCEIPAGYQFKDGVSHGGSVTCQPGYFACCGVYNKCLPNDLITKLEGKKVEIIKPE